MKKITTTKTTVVAGFESSDYSGAETTTDYVSDGYTYEDYWQDNMPDSLSLVDREPDAVNYTQTMRETYQYVENVSSGLEGAWETLDLYATRISTDATLDEDDRENLSSALDDVVRDLSALSDECGEALASIDAALDAFKRLPMAE